MSILYSGLRRDAILRFVSLTKELFMSKRLSLALRVLGALVAFFVTAFLIAQIAGHQPGDFGADVISVAGYSFDLGLDRPSVLIAIAMGLVAGFAPQIVGMLKKMPRWLRAIAN